VRETTVSFAQAVTAPEAVLPVRVQEALGELVGVAKEGLLALSVGVGLGVLAELMEEEVVEVVGPKGRQDPDRVAVRHGPAAGEVTLGGRRVAVARPRARSADGTSEVPLVTYAHFADRDPFCRVVLEQMLAGVSTRRYRRTQEPVGEQVETEARSTSKSAVSRQFVARTRENLEALMRRRLDDVRLAVLMVDGIDLKSRTNVVALGITLAGELDRSHPGAAASLCEGLEETLTLQRLGILGNLKTTLASTNPCESMIECVRRTSRNVKRWRSGEMCLRWTAVGMLEAERQFRRVIGYRDLAQLAVAIERDLTRPAIPF
jgi:hypothetical protein